MNYWRKRCFLKKKQLQDECDQIIQELKETGKDLLGDTKNDGDLKDQFVKLIKIANVIEKDVMASELKLKKIDGNLVKDAKIEDLLNEITEKCVSLLVEKVFW